MLGRSKRPHSAAKSDKSIREHEAAGIKFEDAANNRAKLDELNAEQEAWRNVGTHPELLEEAKAEFDKTDEGAQQYFDFGANFSIQSAAPLPLVKAYAVDKNGVRLDKETFVKTPAGNLNWFEFPSDEKTQAILKKKRIKPLPIRLRIGVHKNTHNGFGFLHVLNHLPDMSKLGESPLMSLYNTLTNLDGMSREGNTRYRFRGAKSYLDTRLLVVDLLEDEGCYSIVTSYPTTGRRNIAGNELLIGRALFRFTAGDKQTQFQGGQTTNKNATSAASGNGKAPAQTISEQPTSVNIYDVKILDKNKNIIFTQQQEPAVNATNFSIQAASLPDRFAGHPLAERMSNFMRTEARRYERTLSKQTPGDAAANALFATQSIIHAVAKYVQNGAFKFPRESMARLKHARALF